MRGKEKEQWMNLCEKAADENDPKRLQELAADITLMLKMKATRMEHNRGTRTDGVLHH
jgi:hypothetical protein